MNKILKNIKTIGIWAAAILVLVVIFQNIAKVETQILFIKVTMPLVVLLLLTLAIGFAAGFWAARHYRIKLEKRSQQK